MARALEVPMYRLFTDAAHVKQPNIPVPMFEIASNKKQDSKFRPFAKALSQLDDKDRGLLLYVASKMVNRAV